MCLVWIAVLGCGVSWVDQLAAGDNTKIATADLDLPLLQRGPGKPFLFVIGFDLASRVVVITPAPTEVSYDQQPPRTLLPKASDRAEDSKHRFSKSRNGMFVFVCSLKAICALLL